MWDEHVPERFCEQDQELSLHRAVGLPQDTLAGTFAEPQVALAGSGVGRGVGRGVGAGAGGWVVAGGAAASVVLVVGGTVAGGLVTGGVLPVGDVPPPPHDERRTASRTADERFISRPRQEGDPFRFRTRTTSEGSKRPGPLELPPSG